MCCVLCFSDLHNPLFSGLSQPVQQQPMTTMSNTYSSAPDPDGPPLPQSASAEHDRSLHEAQAPVTAATANPPQQTEQGV